LLCILVFVSPIQGKSYFCVIQYFVCLITVHQLSIYLGQLTLTVRKPLLSPGDYSWVRSDETYQRINIESAKLWTLSLADKPFQAYLGLKKHFLLRLLLSYYCNITSKPLDFSHNLKTLFLFATFALNLLILNVHSRKIAKTITYLCQTLFCYRI